MIKIGLFYRYVQKPNLATLSSMFIAEENTVINIATFGRFLHPLSCHLGHVAMQTWKQYSCHLQQFARIINKRCEPMAHLHKPG